MRRTHPTNAMRAQREIQYNGSWIRHRLCTGKPVHRNSSQARYLRTWILLPFRSRLSAGAAKRSLIERVVTPRPDYRVAAANPRTQKQDTWAKFVVPQWIECQRTRVRRAFMPRPFFRAIPFGEKFRQPFTIAAFRALVRCVTSRSPCR